MPKIKQLLENICVEELEINPSLMKTMVDFLYVDELVGNQEINWDIFVREIKFKNRFFRTIRRFDIRFAP